MAYAAINSLIESLEQLLNPNLYVMIHEKEQFESLHEKLRVLQTFLDDSINLSIDHKRMKYLEKQIRDVAYKAEDYVELYMCKYLIMTRLVKNVIPNYPMLGLYNRLPELLEDLDSIILEVKKNCLMRCGTEALQERKFSAESSLHLASNQQNIMVGLNDDVIRIKDRLIGPPARLEMISIVGMGGIGKTTLARRIFHEPSIEYHFQVRAWVTVSQEYRVRDLLLGILLRVTQLREEDWKKSNEDLAEKLYKSLKGRRYLIVLDDMWSNMAWDDFKLSFPNDCNGSRIMLTSRLKEVADHVHPNSYPHFLNLLSSDVSWELLCEKVFGKQSCPEELIDIGMKIAEKCKGLPLAIVVVAGHLSKISRTYESWAWIAASLNSLLSTGQDACLEILALSYNYLPHHLKACFLYMGTFPEDSHIRVWQLIMLWIAEGLLKPIGSKTLEEVAEDYLDDLVERTLVFPGERKSDGKIKTCHIHDLLRDLCLREAERENFMFVVRRQVQNLPVIRTNQRRISFYSNLIPSNLSIPLMRSFLYFHKPRKIDIEFPADSFFSRVNFKMVRVLNIGFLKFSYFPSEVVELINLRYLALFICAPVPKSIFNLCNLQILILRSNYTLWTLPWEVWKMPQLRHLHFGATSNLPDPCTSEYGGNNTLFLQNLQSVSKLSLASCTMNVLSNIPNLKMLKVVETKRGCLEEAYFDAEFDAEKFEFEVVEVDGETFEVEALDEDLSANLKNIANLHQLETLKYTFRRNFSREPRWIPHLDSYPPKLKKLTLICSRLPWKIMDILALCPNLEVLKLRDNACVGPEWKQVTTGFCQLKFLLIENTDLVHWEVTSSQLPSLQHLVLRFCGHLKEIPSDVGEIPTLERIEMRYCSSSAVASAREIQQEQQSMGNDSLDVRYL